MIVGVAKLSFVFFECHSLKERRSLLLRIKNKTSNKFPVSIAEISDEAVAGHPFSKGGACQRAVIGFASVGSETQHVNSIIDNVIHFITGLYLGDIVDKRIEFINV